MDTDLRTPVTHKAAGCRFYAMVPLSFRRMRPPLAELAVGRRHGGDERCALGSWKMGVGRRAGAPRITRIARMGSWKLGGPLSCLFAPLGGGKQVAGGREASGVSAEWPRHLAVVCEKGREMRRAACGMRQEGNFHTQAQRPPLSLLSRTWALSAAIFHLPTPKRSFSSSRASGESFFFNH
jgi:hypothetical protein